MSELQIKSATSDLELILSDINGDYFSAQIEASHINAKRKVWAYTDAYGFADLLENLSSLTSPWEGEEVWESLEGEFRFSASCSKLGQITFEVALLHQGCPEEWLLQTQIKYEFGQLPKLAKSARAFFGESPS